MTPQEAKTRWPFDIEPREVQLEALAAGYGKPGFAYFIRQRLGKTWISFAEYTLLRQEGLVDWCFVIAPNSLKSQWQEDIERVNPYIPICLYSAKNRARAQKFFKTNKRGGVFIINYESLQSFNDDFVFMTDGVPLFDTKRTYIIADESTRIKEPSLKMTKAAHALSTMCPYKRVLTGKPTANSNADIWAQLKFIEATPLTFYQHKHYYVIMGGYLGRQIVKNINTDDLKRRMAPFCYIAPDKYIKGFEKVYEPMRRIALGSELEKQYKQMEDDLVLTLSSDTKITAPIALTKYLRLQQISSGVAGDIDGAQHNLIDPFANPRIRVVREILDNEISNKVIIACRFRLSIDNLERVLTADGHKVSKLIGGMSDADIREQKALFNKGDHNVLIGQLQVLAYGHTLPGNDSCPCDSMIFYENDFSLLNRMQCESRPEDADFEKRTGTNKTISHYDMYASKMDRYMIQALIKKEDASLKLMGYARKHGLRPELSKETGSELTDLF